MNRRKDIQEEWQELTPKLGHFPFSAGPSAVPAGFFAGFFPALMAKIRQLDTSEAEGTQTAFPDVITAAEEIEALSPLLAGISRKTPFQPPDGYFNQFRVTGTSIAAAGHSKPPVVVRIGRSGTWARLAVAAAITGILATGAFFYYRPAAGTPLPAALASVSDQDMVNYLANQDIPLEGGIEQNGPQIYNDTEITDLMSNVSDDELVAYAAAGDGPGANLN